MNIETVQGQLNSKLHGKQQAIRTVPMTSCTTKSEVLSQVKWRSGVISSSEVSKYNVNKSRKNMTPSTVTLD